MLPPLHWYRAVVSNIVGGGHLAIPKVEIERVSQDIQFQSHNKHHGGLYVVLGEWYKNAHNFIKKEKYVWKNCIWVPNVIIYHLKHTFA